MSLDTYGSGFLLVMGSSGIAVLGLLLTRRYINLDCLRASHDVGGYLLSVVGTLYAVLLGLVVVDSMQKFQNAREITEREANSLADVFLLSSRLPDKQRGEIRNLCIAYGRQVMDVEWNNMEDGKYCPEAQRLAIRLVNNLLQFEPETENQKVLYPQMVADATEVWQCRRARINMAVNGVPVPEWIALIGGGIVTMFFTFFFGLENLRLQIIMTSMVAMLISLNVYLVLLFGYPFSGDLCMGMDSFKINQLIFENRIAEKN